MRVNTNGLILNMAKYVFCLVLVVACFFFFFFFLSTRVERSESTIRFSVAKASNKLLTFPPIMLVYALGIPLWGPPSIVLILYLLNENTDFGYWEPKFDDQPEKADYNQSTAVIYT